MMGYKNFEEYWESKKEVYTQLGVTEAVAHSIWNDAVDTLALRLLEKQIKNS
jgi:hypothetical protein